MKEMKKPFQVLPDGDDIEEPEEEDDTPSKYPNKSLNKAMRDAWNRKHKTSDRVNIKTPRKTTKRSDRN